MKRKENMPYKKIVWIVLLTILLQGGIQAQDAGTESNFSVLGFGARAIGMGQAFTAVANDATAMYWNPAGMEYVNSQSATFFHSTLFDGVQYDFLGFVYPTLELGTFGVGVSRLGVTGIEEVDRFKNFHSTFSNEDYHVYLSYAKNLIWDISAGVTVRWIRTGWSNLREGDPADNGVGADIGIMYRPQYTGNVFLQDWSIGVKVHNLFAPQLKVGDKIDAYNITSKFGLMRTIRFGQAGNLNLVMDLSHAASRDFKMHFGSEYSFKDMGKLRVGYNGSTVAFGVGAEYSIFEIDYGYGAMEHAEVFSATHRISLTVNFGLTRDEMYDIAELQREKEEERIKIAIREQDKRDFIEKHLVAADNFFNDKKYLDAIVEYQQVIGVDPFHFRAGLMHDSSNVLLQQEFDAKQSIAVNSAIDKERAASDSIFVQTHFEKGRAFLEQNRFLDAKIEFNIALERKPDNQILKNSIRTTDARINQEVSRLIDKSREEFNNNNYSEALRLIGDARILGADNDQLQKEVETLASLIALQQNIQNGLLLYSEGRYDEAGSIFSDALRIDPENKLVQQYFEKSRLESNSTNEKLDPESAKKLTQGMRFYTRAKYREAIKIWEEILIDHPYNKIVLESINNARERLKNTKKN